MIHKLNCVISRLASVLFVMAFTVLFSLSIFSEVPLLPTIPKWLSGHEDLLPPISREAFASLKDAWTEIRSKPERAQGPGSEKILAPAAKVLLELGDQASKGMVWLYIDGLPSSVTEENVTVYSERYRSEKKSIISTCETDPEFGKWMIPLARQRMAWASDEIKSHRMPPSFLHDEFSLEMSDMFGVIEIHGIPADIDFVFTLREEFKTVSEQYASALKYFTDEKEDLLVKQKHAAESNLIQPFHEQFRYFENYLGPIHRKPAEEIWKENHSNGTVETAKVNVPNTQLEKQVNTEPKKKTWLILVALIFTMAGGAALLIRSKYLKK